MCCVCVPILDSTLQGREARSLENVLLSCISATSIRDPTPDYVSPASDRSDGCYKIIAGVRIRHRSCGSFAQRFQKGAAKPVQNLTPEPADTIP